MDRPDLYVAYAIALWAGDDYTFRSLRRSLDVRAASGTIRNADVIGARRHRASFVSALDWMTMASLSGASHGGSPRAGDDGSGMMSEWNAITWPSMVKKWFGAVGCSPQLDSVGLGAFNASAEDLLDLLAAWDNHWLVLEIDASLLEGGGVSISNRHWVVVNPIYRPAVRASGGRGQSPAAYRDSVRAQGVEPVFGDETGMAGVIEYETKMGEAAVDMEVVSWADDSHRFLNTNLGHIASLFYGGYAFPRIR